MMFIYTCVNMLTSSSILLWLTVSWFMLQIFLNSRWGVSQYLMWCISVWSCVCIIMTLHTIAGLDDVCLHLRQHTHLFWHSTKLIVSWFMLQILANSRWDVFQYLMWFVYGFVLHNDAIAYSVNHRTVNHAGRISRVVTNTAQKSQ